MQQRFEFKCNHLIARLGADRALIDTGSPASFGDVRTVTVAGHTHDLRGGLKRPDAGEVTAERVRLTAAAADYPLNINCLLGMDILGADRFTIDMRQRLLEFGRLPECGGTETLEVVQGLPVLRVLIAGEPRRCVFDTAAVPCFLRPSRMPAGDVVRTDREFTPLLDEPFLTPIRVLPLWCFGRCFSLEVGELPEVLASGLESAGLDGVVGNKILEYGRLGLDVPGKKAVFEPY